ncbi:MAG: right-handed parallel beta-helix repeat-containing protein [Desulfosarcina sp.]|nr:right-handed parallel beta-helix repeat-containing protein [Desulfobacterales bacterium]
MELFSTTPDVVANGSIHNAIESCDDIVGEGKYCVVEIGNTAGGLPLEIYRSKTKLMGVSGMNPLGSDQNEIFIYIGDKTQKVIIEGLNLQGHSAGQEEIYGIMVEGKRIRNIAIRNNKIHGFDSDNNAHGIAVYGIGKSKSKGIRDVIIEGNEVYSMRTGSSESIVVNGNVRRWEIKNNDVYDVNNIAIYVDGGHHIQITDNVVVNASWGYDIGAENCLTTRHITMTGNRASESTFGDLLLGGYAETGYRDDRKNNCNPDSSEDDNEGHGSVSYLTIKNNHFISTDTQLDPVTLQYRTTHAIVAEPGVTPENEDGNGSARGDENAVRTEE